MANREACNRSRRVSFADTHANTKEVMEAATSTATTTEENDHGSPGCDDADHDTSEQEEVVSLDWQEVVSKPRPPGNCGLHDGFRDLAWDMDDDNDEEDSNSDSTWEAEPSSSTNHEATRRAAELPER